MNGDLISRSALLRSIAHLSKLDNLTEEFAPAALNMLRAVIYYIQSAPTVDAVEVVHGRWEKCWQDKSKHYFRCSICHTAYMDGVSGAIGPEYGSRAWRYCPNCGAKMDGGEENAAD